MKYFRIFKRKTFMIWEEKLCQKICRIISKEVSWSHLFCIILNFSHFNSWQVTDMAYAEYAKRERMIHKKMSMTRNLSSQNLNKLNQLWYCDPFIFLFQSETPVPNLMITTDLEVQIHQDSNTYIIQYMEVVIAGLLEYYWIRWFQ